MMVEEHSMPIQAIDINDMYRENLLSCTLKFIFALSMKLFVAPESMLTTFAKI